MKISLRKLHIIFLSACIIIILANQIIGPNEGIISKCINTSNEKSDRIKIIIDPGHGGVDPGAVGKYKDNEDVINLAIAYNLMHFLLVTGFDVEMTRYEDEGLYTEKSTTYRSRKNEDLRNRVNIINNSDANVCISIHLNCFPQKKYYGAQTFYKRNCEESKDLSKIIQNEMKFILDKKNDRASMVKNDIIIMKNSKIPIVLVECGFLSNPAEEKLLNSNIYQEKIAWAIFSGLLKYFNEEKIKEANDELSTKGIFNASSTNNY